MSSLCFSFAYFVSSISCVVTRQCTRVHKKSVGVSLQQHITMKKTSLEKKQNDDSDNEETHVLAQHNTTQKTIIWRRRRGKSNVMMVCAFHLVIIILLTDHESIWSYIHYDVASICRRKFKHRPMYFILIFMNLTRKSIEIITVNHSKGKWNFFKVYDMFISHVNWEQFNSLLIAIILSLIDSCWIGSSSMCSEQIIQCF